MNKQTTIEWNQAIQDAKELKKLEQERAKEFQLTLKEAKEDVDEALNSGQPVNYSDIEDLMLGHGLEMDYFEDMYL